MPRSVDDHLLVLECGVQVRDNPDLPARTVGLAAGRRDREDLGRRPVLAPFAERALFELLSGWRLESPSLRARSFRALGRDDDGPAGERVAPDFRRQLFGP